MDTSTVVQAIDVSVAYHKDHLVVDRCSFGIEPGERVALFGMNGSGKTTLLLACAGLLPCTGDILFKGIPLNRKTIREIRGHIGFLFSIPDDQILFSNVIDDVSFTLRQRLVDPTTTAIKATEALEMLGAGHLQDRSVHELSYGQRMRVALAGAMVHNPALLLLDEPSAGLDPPGKKKLASYLTRSEAAMLVATHDLDFARHFCTRYMLIENGQITAAGTDLDELKAVWEY